MSGREPARSVRLTEREWARVIAALRTYAKQRDQFSTFQTASRIQWQLENKTDAGQD